MSNGSRTARKAYGSHGARAAHLAAPGHGLLSGRIAPLRGSLATTACMETLQVGYLHAVAAAAGCSLSQPFPDNGIDWHVSQQRRRPCRRRRSDDQGAAQVHLPDPAAPAGRGLLLPELDNDHLVKLAPTPVSVHKILVVRPVPRSRDEWLRAGHDRLKLTAATGSTWPDTR